MSPYSHKDPPGRRRTSCPDETRTASLGLSKGRRVGPVVEEGAVFGPAGFRSGKSYGLSRRNRKSCSVGFRESATV